MVRKEGSGREARTSAQRHVSSPVGRMQVTVHAHQVMCEACNGEKGEKINFIGGSKMMIYIKMRI